MDSFPERKTNLRVEIAALILFALIFGLSFLPGHDILHAACLVLPVLMGVIYLFLFRSSALPAIVLFAVPISVSTHLGGGVMLSFPSEILVGALSFIFIGDSLLHPKKYTDWLKHPIVLLLLAEVSWMVICSMFSNMPLVGFKRTGVRISYILVFLLFFAATFRRHNKAIRLILVYSIGCLYPIVHTIINHAKLGFVPITAYWMPKPFFNDHTMYGACLAFVIPGLLVMCFNAKVFRFSGWKFAAVISLTLILVVAEILSFSRAAWVSLVLAGAFAILIRFRVKLWMIVTFLLIFVSVVFVMRDSLSELARKNESVSSKGSIKDHILSVTNIQNDASNLERINRWNAAMRMAIEKPIIGFGPGMYQYEYGRFQNATDLTSISTFHGNRGHAHSEFFGALAETGFPGLIFFAVIMFAVIGCGLNVIYKTKLVFNKKLALAVLLGLITFYVHGFFNAFLDTDKLAILVFGGIGILIYLQNNLKNEATVTEN